MVGGGKREARRERAVVFRHKCQTQGGIGVGAFKPVSRRFALSKFILLLA